MSDIKKIKIDLEPKKEDIKEETKIQKKRAITNTDKWKENEKDMLFENQKTYIREIYTNSLELSGIHSIIIQQIKQKINGYHNQDVIKELLDKEKFVDIDRVIELLYKSELICYYCQKPVLILYENVRDMTQWSLDRLDNSEGHNKENVVIACLSCNLHRKTMHHERYVFTKQLNIIKKIN